MTYFKTSEGQVQARQGLYDSNRKKLLGSTTLSEYAVNTVDDLVDFLSNPEEYTTYFSENDIYISTKILQIVTGAIMSPTTFTQTIKKLYDIKTIDMLGANIAHVKCTFINGQLKILK